MRVYLTGLLTAATLSLSCVGDSPLPKQGPSSPPAGEAAKCEDDLGARVLRRLSAWEFERTLRDIFALDETLWGGPRLGADPLSKHGFTNDASLLLVGSQSAGDILATAEDVASIVVEADKLVTLLPCASSSLDDDCVGEFIARYGRRLYRRDLKETEQAEYKAYYQKVRDAADASLALKWTLVTLIQSPHAVYRSERGVSDGGHFNLTQYELATELAYAFTGTTPSEELLEKAERAELGTTEALVAEARLLMDTPRGHEAVQRLLEEWSGYFTIRGKAKNDVDDFDVISDRMAEETRRFLGDVVIENQGGVRELLTASHTFVDETLASYYGFPASDKDFQRVERPSGYGVGLLSQGSILSTYAHMDSSSPTLRGLFIYRKLLCQESEAPANVELPPLPEAEPGVVTTRERYESHHAAVAECKYCHQNFDPLGFAFEHFDATGRYRKDEHGLPIDDSGQIPLLDQDPVAFQGPTELASTLAESEEVSACISELFARYTYGDTPCESDSLLKARKGLHSGEYGLSEYLVQLAATPHFRRRKR